MARISKQSLMYGVRGMFGGQVVFKKRRGKRYVAAAPQVNENRVPAEKEYANRLRFKRSNDYASTAVKIPELKAQYEAVAKKGQTANNVAFSDAFHAPKILAMLTHGYYGVKGNVISIQATDNFKVTAVKVFIYDAANTLVEGGDAIDNGDKLNWMYTVTANVMGSRIVAKAYDLPGNETVQEMIL